MGSVKEAEVKRFSNTTDYLKNARTEKFIDPVLLALNDKEEILSVSPNDAKYRFCFVEKNRIDDFARMAAKEPAQQSKLIGTLFGLESFDEFVKGFSNELDSKYIDLSGQKAILLRDKRTALIADEQTVVSEKKEIEELTSAENLTASKFKDSMSYADFVSYLGTQEKPGRIEELEQLTEKPLSKKIGSKLSSLTEIDISLKATQEKIISLKKEFETKKNQISFRNLCQAVKELRNENPDICPACSTPLQDVVQNPYLRAETGLQDLEHLSNLEQKLNDEKELHQISLSELYRLVKSAADFEQSDSDNKLTINKDIPSSENEATSEWWLNLKKHSEAEVSTWQKVEEVLAEIEKNDSDIKKLESTRPSLLEELKNLRIYKETVVRHDEARKNKNKAVTNAKIAIEQFETNNKTLIEDVEAEKQIVVTNKRIAKAYKEFIENLNNYRKALPEQLIVDLEDKVKVLYNGFNRSDPTQDILAEIRLPLASGSKIEIAFNSNPSLFFDALHVLSEGHIRCLGLSILLAKNLKQKSPILIFDDPVNAIDDDHREGIRRTIFEDDFFANSQIILTCHGEEFFKDVQNLLGAEKLKESKTFSFIPHLGDNQIQVDSSPSSRNYVVLAREHFSKGEIRESLAKSRRALEFLGKGTWRLIAKYGDGNLSLKFRNSKSKAELRNLIDQLRCKSKKDDFVHPHKCTVKSALDSLLGIDGQSREWSYLNGGTHEEEDRTEFDRLTVEEIVKSLESLDSVLKGK